MVETAELYAEDSDVIHNKFDYFCYYRAMVRYNVSVTLYSLDDVPYYLDNPENVVVYDKSKVNREEAAGSHVPSLSNDSPYFDTTIAKNPSGVNTNSMQDEEDYTSPVQNDGQYAFLSDDGEYTDEGAKIKTKPIAGSKPKGNLCQ